MKSKTKTTQYLLTPQNDETGNMTSVATLHRIKKPKTERASKATDEQQRVRWNLGRPANEVLQASGENKAPNAHTAS
jgi:hypothetical protein